MVLLELITFASFIQSDVCPGQTDDILILESKSNKNTTVYCVVCEEWESNVSKGKEMAQCCG